MVVGWNSDGITISISFNLFLSEAAARDSFVG